MIARWQMNKMVIDVLNSQYYYFVNHKYRMVETAIDQNHKQIIYPYSNMFISFTGMIQF